jgi:lysophospholipase L1-like esterase
MRPTALPRPLLLTAAGLLAAATAVVTGGHGVAGAATSPTYVALGDSFSSGEGSTPYESGTDTSSNTCHRSTQAYGSLLAVADGYSTNALPSTNFAFAACSGAVTNDLFSANHENTGEPPQLSALGPATQKVTLTIGGNDLGFGNVLSACLDEAPQIFGVPGPDTGIPGSWGCSVNATVMLNNVSRALQALAGSLTGEVVRNNTPITSGSNLGTPKTDLNGNQIPIHSISSVLAAIHAAAPNAHIFLSRYPSGFGTGTGTFLHNSFDSYSHYDCDVTPPTGVTVDYNDAQWTNQLLAQYSQVEATAVSQAVASGINATLVDPSANFAGHANCDTLDTNSDGSPKQPVATYKWINGISPTGTGSFHPNSSGHALAFEPAFLSAGF